MRDDVIESNELSRTFIDIAHEHVTKNVIYAILSDFGNISVNFD